MDGANKDHACWERPEDMDTLRSVFKIDINTPGSDVAIETAATSVVFRRSDPTYSNLHIMRAIRVKFYLLLIPRFIFNPIIQRFISCFVFLI